MLISGHFNIITPCTPKSSKCISLKVFRAKNLYAHLKFTILGPSTLGVNTSEIIFYAFLMLTIIRSPVLGVNTLERKANCGTNATYSYNTALTQQATHSNASFNNDFFFFLCGKGRGGDSRSTSISSRLREPPES